MSGKFLIRSSENDGSFSCDDCTRTKLDNCSSISRLKKCVDVIFCIGGVEACPTAGLSDSFLTPSGQHAGGGISSFIIRISFILPIIVPLFIDVGSRSII